MKVKIFNQYVGKVCKLFAVDKDTLFTKTKRRDVVDARHFLYYLSHKRPMKIVYIQEYMFDNGYEISHSSIIHGIKQVESKLERNDPDYTKIVENITNV